MLSLKIKKSPAGFTLMEILLTIGLLAIFGVFVLEFLTTAWLGTEKDLSRIKCITAAENIIEMANALAIESGEDLEDTYKRLFKFDGKTNVVMPAPVPVVDLSTYTRLIPTSPIHPDGVGEFFAMIATYSDDPICTYTVKVGDQFLANVVEIQTAYATQSVMIDYNFELGLKP